jgi:hypothetical protein
LDFIVRMWFGVRGSGSLASPDGNVSGRLFMIHSTLVSSVRKDSSFKICPFSRIIDDKIDLTVHICLSQTPPM